jgi:nitroreductase/dihydropteridine reductase
MENTSFLQSMQKRYTTKNYDITKKISNDTIKELKEILRLTPSSINCQPWKFTFVQDAETKQKLSKISKINTQKVIDCDTLVVFSRFENLDKLEEQIETELPEKAYDYYKNKMKNQSPEDIKIWMGKQVYIALGVFLSACAEMGIDSTPMEGIEPENYDNVLNQTDYTTLCAVAIGYRTKNDYNQPSLKPKSRIALEKIITTI